MMQRDEYDRRAAILQREHVETPKIRRPIADEPARAELLASFPECQVLRAGLDALDAEYYAEVSDLRARLDRALAEMMKGQ